MTIRSEEGSTRSGTRRRVVYTALIGNYERLNDAPSLHAEGIDFILFTDDPSIRAGEGWRTVCVVPRFPHDTVRSARYLKVVGHPMLEAYDESLWIDNRVVLQGEVAQIFDLLGDHDIALAQHSFRATLRDEFEEVIASGYDDPARVRSMYQLVSSLGIGGEPAMWTGILVRRHSATMAECMRIWADLILLTSRRDQLSINAALAMSSAPISVNLLDLDNRGSRFHRWLPPTTMGRNRRIQRWRHGGLPFRLRLADAIRSTEVGRKGARLLSRAGLTLPTVD